MNFILTGGTGFFGPHLIKKLLSNGHAVTAIIRRTSGSEHDMLDVLTKEEFDSINFVFGDLLDKNSLDVIFKTKSYEGCFHLAAQSHVVKSFTDPIGTLQVNAIGTANLMSAIEHGSNPVCKICVVSTSEVYGNTGKDGACLKETDSLSPANPYSASKISADVYAQERFKNGNNIGFITRAFSHTGPRRPKIFSISSDAYQLAALSQMNLGEKNKINVGNLETVRCVLDVADVVDAYYLLMMHYQSNGKVFNVSGDAPRKMGWYTDKLIELANIGAVEKIVSPELYRPIDIRFQYGDTTALRTLTGWEPKIPIEETLQSLLDYWKRKFEIK